VSGRTSSLARTWRRGWTGAVARYHPAQALGLSSLFDTSARKTPSPHPVTRKRPLANATKAARRLSAMRRRASCSKRRQTTLKGKRDRAILATLLYHGLP